MRTVIVICLSLFMISCSSHVPLTTALIKEYGLSSKDIPKLQLYLSDGILLEKQITKIDKNIDSNYTLKKVEDYYVKQIYFKKETPCIAITAATDNVRVAFEEQSKTLQFAAHPRTPDVPFIYQPAKKYSQDASETRPSSAGFTNWTMIGEDSYSDSTFTVFVKNREPFLLVDKTSLKNIVVEARSVKGLKQSDVNIK